MEIENTKIESFLKSFGFSFMLFLYPAFFTFLRTWGLIKRFDFFELLYLIHSVTLAVLFLIRSRPSIVSMNLIHWVVALITSFSGFFFIREKVSSHPIQLFIADNLIFVSFLMGIAAVLTLGRSLDLLPALRKVKTGFVYQCIRHPMYLSSIVLRLGYALKNPSIYNLLVLVIMIALYDKRAKYEEEIMSYDDSYKNYLLKVKYRFLPGIY